MTPEFSFKGSDVSSMGKVVSMTSEAQTEALQITLPLQGRVHSRDRQFLDRPMLLAMTRLFGREIW